MIQAEPTSLRAGRLLARPGHVACLGSVSIKVQDGVVQAVSPEEDQAFSQILALPGFTNAHDHGRGLRSLAVGAVDEALESWVVGLAAEPVIDPYLRAAVAFGRMVESGICATNHCHNTQNSNALLQEAEAVARAAQDVGLRVAFAVPFAGRNPLVYGDPAGLFARLTVQDRAMLPMQRDPDEIFAERLALFERIVALESLYFRVQYGPVGPQWISDAGLAVLAEESARTGRGMHMHFFETRAQREWADSRYPDGYVRHLDAIGLLSGRLTLAHATWLRQDEAALLAERGVTVSVNASSNLRLSSGIAPLGMFRAAGLRLAIGLDGMALDDDEDFLREIRLLWHLARTAGNPADALSKAEIFDAALRVGRKTVLGADNGGVVAVGAPADIVLLDYGAMTRDVIVDDIDPTDILLTRMSRRHVREVMVAGRVVVRDGKCCSVDLPALEAALLDQARAARPDDASRRRRLRAAIADFYVCGCHLGVAGRI